MKQFLTQLVFASVFALAIGCGPQEPIPMDGTGEAAQGIENADTVSQAACIKQIYVHIANFNYFEAPAGGNGCWSYERLIQSGTGNRWSECWYSSSPVKAWGTGNLNWAYNETAFTHTAAGDEGALIDQCYSTLSSGFGTSLPLGTAYMMYQGSSGWRATGATKIAKRFAEVYGSGTFYPYYSQWKSNPVGRPMVNMSPDNSYPEQAKQVMKAVCNDASSGTWIGIYSSRDTRNGSVRMNEIVQALNECTTGT